MKGLGTLINVVTVLAGSGLGLWLGARLSPRTREVLTGGLGVVTVLIGLDMARETANILIVLGSVLLGGLVGSALELEARLDALGRAVERALRSARTGPAAVAAGLEAEPRPVVVSGPQTPPRPALEAAGGPVGAGSATMNPAAGTAEVPARRGAARDPARTAPEAAAAGDGTLARGFIAASLLFCVGPMTFLGSIQDGLTGDYQLLAVKAALDGFASLAMAPALGAGVALAAVTVLVVQGGLTLLAGVLSPLVEPAMLQELTAAGGALVVMIGFGLLEIKRLPVADFLPALGFAPLIAALVAR
ncbi:MAG TPA: DUF554 domain-containing protein [Thermaerobacter sp.]